VAVLVERNTRRGDAYGVECASDKAVHVQVVRRRKTVEDITPQDKRCGKGSDRLEDPGCVE
jgi:hypothetical protein